MGDLQKSLDFYKDNIRPEMHKFLVGFCVLFGAIFSTEYLLLKHFENTSLLQEPLGALLSTIVSDIIMSLSLWYFIFKRQKKFRPNQVGILIALTKLDEVVDSELTRLYKKLEYLINTENFISEIKITMVPDFLIPKNETSAHSLRDKLNAQLIVWGNVDRGNHDSDSHTVFIPIHFSYRLHLPPDAAAQITQGFNHVLANRRWIISESSNIVDREYLAANLEEVALYMIGAVLFFARRTEEALEVLKKVLHKYKNKTLLTQDDKIAIINIKILIFQIYRTKGRELNLRPSNNKIADQIEKAEKLVTDIRELGNEPAALLYEGQVEFAKGARGQAMVKLKQAETLLPNDPSACFSLAYLYFFDEDLPNGWMWLKKAKKRGDKSKILEQIPNIATWYEDILSENGTKHYINFPLGIIYFEYLKDIKNSKILLESFLDKYSNKNDKRLRPLLIEAERVLKKIKKEND